KYIIERDYIIDLVLTKYYTPGSPEYEDYYRRHPELKEVDNALRAMPPMGEPGSATYHPVHSPLVGSAFQFLSEMKHLSEGFPAAEKTVVPGPEEMTRLLKGLAAYYGARLTGVCAMEDYHYYSHRGRETIHYGNPIRNSHPYGLVFAVEMEKDMILRAPGIPESLAAVKGYMEGAMIGMILSYYIRSLGFDARNHMDGNYLLIAPLVARDGGLGEIGRHGLLITKEYGPRVRLGVVTTDLPLTADGPVAFGIQDFCSLCNRCAVSCPGIAIPRGGKELIDGDMRWRITDTACYQRWRMLGTDCGVCLASCPFSNELDPSLVDRMAASPDIMHQLLREFNQQYRLRPMVKKPVDWFLKNEPVE
ncbi:MAG: reductive dehalogenase domain-containing protein, partial [Bacillota bacterium]|nr:reductive dehalogenase domain-containing protein [Bacillota bacterium]